MDNELAPVEKAANAERLLQEAAVVIERQKAEAEELVSGSRSVTGN